MSAHGATRQRAFATACTLAAAGKRPTIAAVREGLDGKGSQQAIGAGIDDWLDEAARRFQIPGIPEALRTQVVAVWDQACRLAGEQWSDAKMALEGQVSALDAQVAAVAGERDAASTEIERLTAELTSQGTTLRETQDALDLAGNTLANPYRVPRGGNRGPGAGPRAGRGPVPPARSCRAGCRRVGGKPQRGPSAHRPAPGGAGGRDGADRVAGARGDARQGRGGAGAGGP